jgi:DNA-binding LytR/AlgR family response regulator
VEPVRQCRLTFTAAARRHAHVESLETFTAARARLETTRFDLVVASLRLGPYNGIHLAHIARLIDVPPHVVVHSDEQDVAAATDVQRACALYERTERLVFALPAYLRGTLPPMDRRDPMRSDRRRIVRGGRRAWDNHLAQTDADATDD